MMESLYKIDKIVGKGMGWIALRDIKCGTLIWKEKPQFNPINENARGLMECFFSMNSNDQKDFLNLGNAFLDVNSLNIQMKKSYVAWKKVSESQDNFDGNLMLKIICIYRTNGFPGQGVATKISRINHSCCSNAEHFLNGDGEIEIRSTSKILAGQEITIKYVNEELKKFKDRQEYFYSYGGFVCSCELCQEENIYNNDEVYEKFQKLQEEVKIILNVLHYENEAHGLSNLDAAEMIDLVEKALACHKQMYNLAKTKKAPKIFIKNILMEAFDNCVIGYIVSKTLSEGGNSGFEEKMSYFKEECGKLSRIGIQIAKMCTGIDSDITKEWKERNEDFENWCKKNK